MEMVSHVLRMLPAALPRVALRWTPDGHRKRGRRKETWRRTVEDEGEQLDSEHPTETATSEHQTKTSGELLPRP